jgi:membrane associated rhomboid family serine protease
MMMPMSRAHDARLSNSEARQMIPLWDASRRPVDFPIVTLLIIALNAIVFVCELAGGDAFILRWSAIPADIMHGRHLETVLTSMFMHAGWAHIIGNMVFLWAFGPEVEDVMGPWRYLGFYLLAGLIAMMAQILMIPDATTPNLGASGAIAAVMGAFVVTFPRDQIKTLLILGFFVMTRFIPAALLIGFWFLLQLVDGFGSIGNVGGEGVAYTAHIAGILFGALTARLFEDPQAVAERAS